MKRSISLCLMAMWGLSNLGYCQVGVGLEFWTLGLDGLGTGTTMVPSSRTIHGGIICDMEMSITNGTGSPLTKTYRLEAPNMWPGDTLEMTYTPDVHFTIEYPVLTPPTDGRVIIEWTATVAPWSTETRKVETMRWGAYDGHSRTINVSPVSGGQSTPIDYLYYYSEDQRQVALQGAPAFARNIPLLDTMLPVWDSLDIVSVVVQGKRYDMMYRRTVDVSFFKGIKVFSGIPDSIPWTSNVLRWLPDSNVVVGREQPIAAPSDWIDVRSVAGRLMLQAEEVQECSLFDISGRQVFQSRLDAGQRETVELKPGVYLLRSTNPRHRVRKVVVW